MKKNSIAFLGSLLGGLTIEYVIQEMRKRKLKNELNELNKEKEELMEQAEYYKHVIRFEEALIKFYEEAKALSRLGS